MQRDALNIITASIFATKRQICELTGANLEFRISRYLLYAQFNVLAFMVFEALYVEKRFIVIYHLHKPLAFFAELPLVGVCDRSFLAVRRISTTNLQIFADDYSCP